MSPIDIDELIIHYLQVGPTLPSLVVIKELQYIRAEFRDRTRQLEQATKLASEQAKHLQSKDEVLEYQKDRIIELELKLKETDQALYVSRANMQKYGNDWVARGKEVEKLKVDLQGAEQLASDSRIAFVTLKKKYEELEKQLETANKEIVARGKRNYDLGLQVGQLEKQLQPFQYPGKEVELARSQTQYYKERTKELRKQLEKKETVLVAQKYEQIENQAKYIGQLRAEIQELKIAIAATVNTDSEEVWYQRWREVVTERDNARSELEQAQTLLRQYATVGDVWREKVTKLKAELARCREEFDKLAKELHTVKTSLQPAAGTDVTYWQNAFDRSTKQQKALEEELKKVMEQRDQAVDMLKAERQGKSISGESPEAYYKRLYEDAGRACNNLREELKAVRENLEGTISSLKVELDRYTSVGQGASVSALGYLRMTRQLMDMTEDLSAVRQLLEAEREKNVKSRDALKKIFEASKAMWND